MIKLKTNVKCDACVATISPNMNALRDSQWKVDLSHPDRILTVEGKASTDEVKKALEQAGYKGEVI